MLDVYVFIFIIFTNFSRFTMKLEKQDLWRDAKTIRIFGKTHRAMQRLGEKGKTYAEIVDDLFQRTYVWGDAETK